MKPVALILKVSASGERETKIWHRQTQLSCWQSSWESGTAAMATPAIIRMIIVNAIPNIFIALFDLSILKYYTLIIT